MIRLLLCSFLLFAIACDCSVLQKGEMGKEKPIKKVEMIYIFWTCRNKEEAKKIIYGLLDKHLIACASIFPEIESIYRWEGKIEEGREAKVILKTQPKHFDAICSFIIENASYEVPEILQVDVPKGNPRYLSWVKEET